MEFKLVSVVECVIEVLRCVQESIVSALEFINLSFLYRHLLFVLQLHLLDL